MDQEFENFKEQVRGAANIVEVVSSYVPLQRKGRRFWGCCPFHGEKTPSFTVTEDKQMFFCFGCHAGGDVFKFVMLSEHCGFGEAVKLLAGRYNIPVPERQKSPQELAREKKAQAVTEANALACRYFQACLTKTPYGKPALAYLEGRGIGSEIIERFDIGYALDSFSSLLTNLGRRGCTEQVLLDAGLLASGRDGRNYDKFRNRIMIPIKNARGQIVGFGGRVLGGGHVMAKYMNTAETEFFNKRYILFAFDIAHKAIREQRRALVVEGYMDAISLHAAGIDNAVASMGTAFSEQQAKLLKRFADEVIFCYDSDAPGRAASVRAVSVARQAGLKVRVAGVPDGKDPDEFIRSHGGEGREAFLQVMESAADGLDFQISEVIRQNNVATLAGKVEAVSNIIPFLLECKNEIEAGAYIRRVAQRLVIDEGLIAEEYRKSARSSANNNNWRASEAKQEQGLQIRACAPQGLPAEKMLLALLLQKPARTARCRETVAQTGFSCRAYQKLFDDLAAYAAGAGGADALPAQYAAKAAEQDEEAAAALAEIAAAYVPEEDTEKILSDCLKQMQRAFWEREYERHAKLAAEYERAADERFVEELTESQRIKHEISKLYGNK